METLYQDAFQHLRIFVIHTIKLLETALFVKKGITLMELLVLPKMFQTA